MSVVARMSTRGLVHEKRGSMRRFPIDIMVYHSHDGLRSKYALVNFLLELLVYYRYGRTSQ